MAADYIPGADGNFDAWQNNFLAYATANAAALGLDPLVDIPPLTAAQTSWTTDFAANPAAQTAAQAARQGKDAARGAGCQQRIGLTQLGDDLFGRMPFALHERPLA